MLTQSDRVKSAIADCDLWYLTRDRNIRTLTERIEAMWFEVEHHVAQMEQAERARDHSAVADNLDRILRYLTRIHAEAEQFRSR